MSLLVWLPLDGNLNNQGLLNIVGTNYNSTVSMNGKIGSCYSFNGTDTRIEYPHNKSVWNNKEITIAFWYKYAEGRTSNTLVDIAADLTAGYTYSSSGLVFSYWRAWSNNGTRTGDSGSTSHYYDATKWHHVAIVYDHNINKIYVDGILSDTFDRSSKYTTNFVPLLGSNYNKITLAKSAGSSPYASGFLNDVRIYDNALSDAEIHELAQGLVVHYKLDDRYVEDSVYLSSEITGTAYNASNGKYSYNATSNLAKTTGFFHGKNCVKVYTLQAGSNAQPYSYFSNLYTSDGTNAPAYKALSFDYYTTCPTTTWLNIYKLGSGSGTATWKTISSVGTRTGIYTNSSNSILVQPNEWNHVEVIFHGTTNANAEWGYCINGPAHVANADYYFLYANIQLEQSDHTTGFNKDFHKGRITDSSGYDHYGIVNDTTLTTVPTTARYEYSMRNNQASNSSTYPFKGVCNIPASSVLTFSWWMNPSTIGQQTSGIFSTSNNNRPTDYQSTAVNMYDSCFSCCNTSGTCVRLNVASYLTVNAWHHYALVYNGSSLIFYKDGVQKTTAAQTGDLKAFAYIFPFYSEAGGAYRCTSGYLSDFRIYVTALSIDDIKALYNVGASIDNKQNLHTYKIREQDNSVIQLLKTGVFLEDELIESDSTQFKNNKIVETNEIIEI